MLICANCLQAVKFAPDGWVHRGSEPACEAVAVVWPPAEEFADDGTEDAA